MNNIIELTDENYSDIIENTNKTIFIDFFSPGCGPCQILTSYLPKIKEYGENIGVLVLKCDVSRNPRISKKYDIKSVPFTCIVTKDKKIEYPEFGIKDISYYINLLDKYSTRKKKNIFFKIISIFKNN